MAAPVYVVIWQGTLMRKVITVSLVGLVAVILLPIGVGAAAGDPAFDGLVDALDTVVELYVAYLGSL